MLTIQKGRQGQCLEPYEEPEANEQHTLKEARISQDEFCQKNKYQNQQGLRYETVKESTQDTNEFIRWSLYASLIVLVFMIFYCVDCAVRGRNFINEQQKVKIQKILNSATEIQAVDLKDDKKLSEENQNLNKQVESLNEKLKSLQLTIDKLKTEFEDQKRESIQIHDNGPEKLIKTSESLPNMEEKLTNQQTQHNQNSQSKRDIDTKTQNPKFIVRQSPRKSIPPPSKKDSYEFTVSTEKLIHYSSMKIIYRNSTDWKGINIAEYQRAIRLLGVTHNINFKSEFVFDHFKFYSSPEKKYQALAEVLKEEKEYYDKKYEINKYIHDQIGMCIFVPSYNTAQNRLYLRNLDSIFQQDYKNYHLVYVNDASTDGTGDYAKAYMEENQIPIEKYTLINNKVNQKGCANLYMVIHNYCREGEILVSLDGDDAFIGRQVLSMLNAVYQNQKVALTYGFFLAVHENRVSKGASTDIPEKYLKNGKFRQLHGFFSSHLKTVYVDVLRQINVSDFQYSNGTFYQSGWDVVFMTPSIEMVGTRLKFTRQLIYEYRVETGLNDVNDDQKKVFNDVFTKAPYKYLESMPFADNPKTVHYE